ncbi:MAG: hypothetical protein M0Q23_05065 [Syntrophales bacterium]|nr:hypothetical protein [Syntrophales bacterium]MCK9528011.1 hypothetical protein [Syntrophales bacterium]MDX9921412.1 hypothetical protein [Syntrophales bacterium]
MITDDTGTQGKGRTQIELTGQYDHDDEKGVKSENWEAKAALSFGLFDSLDLVLEVPYNWASADAGVKRGVNGPEPDISFLAGLAFRV